MEIEKLSRHHGAHSVPVPTSSLIARRLHGFEKKTSWCKNLRSGVLLSGIPMHAASQAMSADSAIVTGAPRYSGLRQHAATVLQRGGICAPTAHQIGQRVRLQATLLVRQADIASAVPGWPSAPSDDLKANRVDPVPMAAN